MLIDRTSLNILSKNRDILIGKLICVMLISSLSYLHESWILFFWYAEIHCVPLGPHFVD